MDIAIAFAKNLSLVLFIAVLLFVYYSFPPEVSLEFDTFGQPVNGISKENIFYTATAVVVVFNLLLTLFVRLFANMPLQKLNVPQQQFWLKDKVSREHFFYVIQSWAYSFMLLINLYTCYVLYRLYDINRYSQQNTNLWTSLILFGILVIGWLSFLFIRFRIKKFHLLGASEDELEVL